MSEQGVRRRRTQAERREESEQRLVIAAAELVATEGFAAVSFDRLGQVSGYSRGLAGRKFGSKDGLIRAVVAFLTERMFAAAEVALDGDKTCASKIADYCENVLRQYEQDRLSRAYLILLTAAIANHDPLRTIFAEAHEKFRDKVRNLIVIGQKEGSIGKGINADGAAITIGGLCLGIATQLLLDPATNPATVRASAVAAIAGALKPEPV